MCKPLYKCQFAKIIIPEVPKQKQRPEAKFPVSLRACYMGFFIFSLPYFVYHPNSSRIISRISLGVFQVSCYLPPFLFRQIYTPVFLPSEQLEDLFKEFKIRSSVRLHVFRLLSDCSNFYQKPFGGVSICNSSFTDESHYDLMTQSS